MKLNGETVRKNVVYAISGFVFLYVTVLLVTTFVVATGGYGLLSSFSTALVTLGNIGPGFGLVGPARELCFLPGLHQVVPELCHDARQAGSVHRSHRVYPLLLAQVSMTTEGESTMRTLKPRPARTPAAPFAVLVLLLAVAAPAAAIDVTDEIVAPTGLSRKRLLFWKREPELFRLQRLRQLHLPPACSQASAKLTRNGALW
ncbi:MAG: hypothetical protein U5L98_08205 [Halomonas sp.]|nr:hypothetical protein [Halomonas sp.]MDZ7852611.1 hypothetical protein [Halomonas sp.]